MKRIKLLSMALVTGCLAGLNFGIGIIGSLLAANAFMAAAAPPKKKAAEEELQNVDTGETPSE